MGNLAKNKIPSHTWPLHPISDMFRRRSYWEDSIQSSMDEFELGFRRHNLSIPLPNNDNLRGEEEMEKESTTLGKQREPDATDNNPKPKKRRSSERT
ncbi:hypothetical protein VNO77_03607 [Canavalia gladiata]|uniref:Uncharacterized protein n=1 Tax=Canavalia gladiata TaxID=3824 RepID=A0AAN9N1E7_CANGL